MRFVRRDRLRNAQVSLGPDGWTDEDGEPFEVEARPTGRGTPSPTTILYALERESTPDEFVETLGDLAEEQGYELIRERTEGGEDSPGKTTIKIVEPVNEKSG